MAGKDEQRERVEKALAHHLLETGLSQTSLRQLARAARVSDRMLLYYFSDKAEVLAFAAGRVAEQLSQIIGSAIPEDLRLPPFALMQRAGALTVQADARPYLRLWVEIVAAAARKEAPFVDIANEIMSAFMNWIRHHLEDDAATDVEATAALVIAAIDGIALVDICLGEEIAARAVGAIARL